MMRRADLVAILSRGSSVLNIRQMLVERVAEAMEAIQQALTLEVSDN